MKIISVNVGLPRLALRFRRRGSEGGASRDASLGPLALRLQGRVCRGEMPEGAHAGTPAWPAVKALSRVLWDTIRGRNTPSPFHEPASRSAFVTPTVLSPAEVEELRGPLAHLPPALGAAEPAGCR